MCGQWPFQLLLLLVVLLTPAVNAHIMVDLYRPLYEAQRGPMLEVRPSNYNNTTSECFKAFAEILYHNIINKNPEMLLALDAFGKPSSGILAGNLGWYGHFSECNSLKDFKYCLLTLDINGKDLGSNFSVIPIQWGVCAPRQCSPKDIHDGAQTLLDFLESEIPFHMLPMVNVSAAVSCVSKPITPYGVGFCITMVIFGIILLLMMIGTIIDVLEQRSLEQPGLSVQSGDITPLLAGQPNGDAESEVNGGSSTYHFRRVENGLKGVALKILAGLRLLCLDFAFNRNLAKLMKISKSNKRSIDCLNGIRVISMLWVMLGHIYYFPFIMGGVFNVQDALGWMKNFMFQTILNAYFSVDTFFFLSGLLVCNLTLLKLESTNGKLPWAWIYLHRYIRLTPVMLVVILIWMYLAPYTIWGPKAGILAARPFCPQYWWANLLYIQNFYPSQLGQACIAWTWYLANDMQFFVISPLIIYALYRTTYIGLGLIGSLLGISLAVTGALTAHYNLGASPSSDIL